MVQLMKSGNSKPDPETTSCREKVPVKLEIVEDLLEEEYGPHIKRYKPSSTLQQQTWCGLNDNDAYPIPPSQYNPLDEPSPLGLRLRKSPSLLDLIQMRLSQGTENGTTPVVKNESKATAAAASGSTDKLKASNFPASILRIGHWEYKSRHEGDLVAKCYFAKHKLVWEVLEGGLKSKIEIQWSDIMALKANCPEDGPGTLNVVLARQPLFFRETNPQPRKHTLWQATADFTDGQASAHRQHFLQSPQGLLNKHFEKLIQCDMRLNFLSQQPEIKLDSPYFEARSSICEDADEFKGDQMETKGPSFSGFQNLASPPANSSSFEIEKGEPSGIGSEHMSREAPSPSSVIDNRAIEGSGIGEVNSKAPRNRDQIKVPGLHPSMSMSDLVNHIEHCISEQMTSGNQPVSEEGSDYRKFLDIAQCLLSDTQAAADDGVDDEKFLMSRVNSLYCLLQMDQPDTAQNSQATGETSYGRPDDVNGKGVQLNTTPESTHGNKTGDDIKPPDGDNTKDVSGSKPMTGMSRKDSFGELLLHLPRIASLPKFLFNISEDDSETKTR